MTSTAYVSLHVNCVLMSYLCHTTLMQLTSKNTQLNFLDLRPNMKRSRAYLSLDRLVNDMPLDFSPKTPAASSKRPSVEESHNWHHPTYPGRNLAAAHRNSDRCESSFSTSPLPPSCRLHRGILSEQQINCIKVSLLFLEINDGESKEHRSVSTWGD